MKYTPMLQLLLGTHLTTRSLISSAPLSTSTRRSALSTKRVVVIGGGAAGYFSAIECAKLLSEGQSNAKGSEKFKYEVQQRKCCSSYFQLRSSKF